jgi:acyl-coenzyme A thioesterase PaaI-like protein
LTSETAALETPAGAEIAATSTVTPTPIDRSGGEPGLIRVGRFEFSPHNCFACGQLNAGGLHLEIHVDERHAWTDVTLSDHFEGWPGIAHGGIVFTILDEVMAWSLVIADNIGVTARMDVAFKRPVPIDRPVHAEGWIVEQRRRRFEVASRIEDAETGESLAEATAVYLAASADRGRELGQRYGLRLIDTPMTSSSASDGGDAD